MLKLLSFRWNLFKLNNKLRAFRLCAGKLSIAFLQGCAILYKLLNLFFNIFLKTLRYFLLMLQIKQRLLMSFRQLMLKQFFNDTKIAAQKLLQQLSPLHARIANLPHQLSKA